MPSCLPLLNRQRRVGVRALADVALLLPKRALHPTGLECVVDERPRGLVRVGRDPVRPDARGGIGLHAPDVDGLHGFASRSADSMRSHAARSARSAVTAAWW